MAHWDTLKQMSTPNSVAVTAPVTHKLCGQIERIALAHCDTSKYTPVSGHGFIRAVNEQVTVQIAGPM
jgi:hypothetical protein